MAPAHHLAKRPRFHPLRLVLARQTAILAAPLDSLRMHPTATPDAQREHFISLLKKFDTAMLLTINGNHGFHARPMAITRVEDDGLLWFFANANSAKIHELQHDSRAFLTAQNGDSAFLSLEGRANLLADREKIADLWSEPLRLWFPGGKDDPSIELIAVRPERGEFWDNTGLNRCKYLWEAALAYVAGSTPKIEEGEQHGKVRL